MNWACCLAIPSSSPSSLSSRSELSLEPRLPLAWGSDATESERVPSNNSNGSAATFSPWTSVSCPSCAGLGRCEGHLAIFTM
uniref:Uncharacterized protein n=1 Tax=Phytophthora fragariae TaxID=53985 RepID=A0A6A3E2J0_9STRA|nr:hypothetical protein PF009_g21849 [Phytophthora fragariae]